MRRYVALSAAIAARVCVALVLFSPATPVVADSPGSDAGATEMFHLGMRGVYFVPNQGQWSDASVAYGFKSRGLDVAFRESALTIHLTREADNSTEASPKREQGVLAVGDPNPLPERLGSIPDPADVQHLTLAVTFPGSNDVQPQGADPQSAKFNYFVGGEWRGIASDVPSFGSVVYKNLYDGIDLLVCGNDDGILKYEFHVAPGSDYSQIRIAYDGIDGLCVAESGDVQIETAFGTLLDNAPIVWQDIDGQRHPVAATFRQFDGRTYTIALLGAIDPAHSVVIDPDVEWMYFLGGSSSDYGTTDVAVDASGYLRATGYTLSSNFDGHNNSRHGDWDGFVVKESPTGAVVWMTYIGGRGLDAPYVLTLDGQGSAFVTGNTSSTDFEGRNNTYHSGSYDSFVARVSASGRIEWMTYLGGSDYEYGWGTAIDMIGDILTVGSTQSTNFEGRQNEYHGGTFDSFIARLSPSGSLLSLNFLGGSGADYGYGIVLDDRGHALMSGFTNSADFEGRANAYHGGTTYGDAYIATINPSGMIQEMTYYGGSGDDLGRDIAIDSSGNVAITGYTYSTDFEGHTNANHGGDDAFVLMANSSSELQWMTYLGGSANEEAFAIALDASGNAMITGETTSSGFEGRDNSIHGGSDAFVAQVSSSGILKWMTYLRGSARDQGVGIALDNAGFALVMGRTFGSANFENRNNSYRGGAADAFLLKLWVGDTLRLVVDAACPTSGPIQISWTGGTPSGRIALLFARDRGAMTVSPGSPCEGTQLGLGSIQIRLVDLYRTDENGEGTISGAANEGVCKAYLQLLDLGNCSTSNVVHVW